MDDKLSEIEEYSLY